MDLAYQAVAALADLHQMGNDDNDSDNRALVTHGDVDITQFVSSDGGKHYKINDFNGALWIYYNDETDGVCPFYPAMGGCKTRSPEEYSGYMVTEKVDIYSIGNVIYSILVGKYPFHDLSSDRVKELVKSGHTPDIPESYQRSDDPNIQALLQAMQLCWVKEPSRRISARHLEEYLRPFATKNKAP